MPPSTQVRCKLMTESYTQELADVFSAEVTPRYTAAHSSKAPPPPPAHAHPMMVMRSNPLCSSKVVFISLIVFVSEMRDCFVWLHVCYLESHVVWIVSGFVAWFAYVMIVFVCFGLCELISLLVSFLLMQTIACGNKPLKCWTKTPSAEIIIKRVEIIIQRAEIIIQVRKQ